MPLGGVVLRDRAAQRHPRAAGEAGQRGIQDLAPDVVEVHVDAVGAVLAQGPQDVLGLVVDRRVEPELVNDVTALLLASGDPDGAAALDLGDLADDAADGARRARHDDRVALLGLADVQQPEVGGHARHPEGAEVDRQRGEPGIDLDHPVAGEHGVLLNPGEPGDVVARRKAGMPGVDHLAATAGAHHLADADRRDVGAAVVHPSPHRRVQRQVLDLDQHLAVARLGHGLLGVVPVSRLGQADRARSETDLAVDGIHRGSSQRN